MSAFQNFIAAQKELAEAKKAFAEAQQAIIDQVGEGNKARYGDFVFTVSKSAETKSTSWKDAFELALTKVNEPTQRVLKTAVVATQKQSYRKPSVRVALKPETEKA